MIEIVEGSFYPVPRPPAKIDFTGQRVNALTAIAYAGDVIVDGEDRDLWFCKCMCGQVVKVDVVKWQAKQFLGCGLQCCDYGELFQTKEEVQKTVKKHKKRKPSGQSEYSRNRSLQYARWRNARGNLCQRWQTFENFAEDNYPTPPNANVLQRINFDQKHSCGKCDECRANGWGLNTVWFSRYRGNTIRSMGDGDQVRIPIVAEKRTPPTPLTPEERNAKNCRLNSWSRYKKQGICERWKDFDTYESDLQPPPADGLKLIRISRAKGVYCGSCDECREKGWTQNVVWSTFTAQRKFVHIGDRRRVPIPVVS